MLYIIAILFPIIAGTAVSIIKMPDGHTRNRLYAAVTVITDILAVFALIYGKPVTLFSFVEGVSVSFYPDPLGKYILPVVLLLYTAATFYAFEYMEHEERQNVFFAFLLISFGALMAVCVSGNLVTLYLSFESLTLTTFPLVLHEMDRAAVAAGLKGIPARGVDPEPPVPFPVGRGAARRAVRSTHRRALSAGAWRGTAPDRRR